MNLVWWVSSQILKYVFFFKKIKSFKNIFTNLNIKIVIFRYQLSHYFYFTKQNIW